MSQGNENLKSVTLLPDEHASKGVSILNWADAATCQGHSIDQMLEPADKDLDQAAKRSPNHSRSDLRTGLRTASAAASVPQLVEGDAELVAFASAYNAGGHVVFMPNVSRDLLATIGLYRSQFEDQVNLLIRDKRERERDARWAWHTALHEVHHSISPMGRRGPEWTSVMEEAVPEVLTPGDVKRAVAKAGADFSLISPRAGDTAPKAVDWPSWNKQHLPKPPTDLAATAKGRYTDGPALLRELLQLAGIDRRTTAGKATALELLQGKSAKFVPRRVAEAIAAEHGLPVEQARDLADLIRKAAIGKATIGQIKAFVAR